MEQPRRLAHVFALLVLAAILLVAACLRFTGLNWDEGQYIHPDEGHMRNTVSLIEWPDDLSLYFDTHRSPLNVRNNEGRRYSYGTLPLFAARAAGEWLDRACTDAAAPLAEAVASALAGPEADGCRPGTFTGICSAVVGRALSALADLGTLILIFLIGRRLYGTAAGLLAAGFGAVTAFMIQQAHFFTVDSMACFFVMLVAYFSVRASQASAMTERVETGSGASSTLMEEACAVPWLDLALAGLATGLAAACKVSAVTAALLVVLAAGQWGARRLSSRWGEPDVEEDQTGGVSALLAAALALVLAGLLSLIAFRIAQPYAFEGPGFLGVRPSPEWFGRLNEILQEQSGTVDLPSGRQWANRLPIVFPWVNIVFWGMGLPLGLAAWIGWGFAGFELFGGRGSGRKHLVLWGWVTVLFLYQATRWVMVMRYFLPLYPILLVFAAAWLVRLAQSASE
ncbi:MAG: glycosyltransferase family 39 protein, partial [Anaerolineae bacterium]